MIKLIALLFSALVGAILALGPLRVWVAFKHLWEESFMGDNFWGPDEQ